MFRKYLALTCLLAGCGHNEIYVYKLYPGPERTDGDLATIRMAGSTVGAKIDGLLFCPAEYSLVHVFPGAHEFEWTGKFWYEAGDKDFNYEKTASVNLEVEAGNTYVLNSGPSGSASVNQLWIENHGSGVVLIRSEGYE